MREGWQDAGSLPEMAGGTAFALDLFGRADAAAQDAVTGFPEMAGGATVALDLFGAEGGSTKAPHGAGGLPEMAGGTAFALDLFGQGDTVAQNTGGASGTAGSAQGGTNGLSDAAGLSLAAGDIVSTASGAANGEFSQTDAADGEFSQTDAANGPGAAANGLPGTDTADGAAVPSGQAGEAAPGGTDAGEAEALLREMRAQYGLPEAGAAELLAAFGEDRSRGQHIREQAARQAAFRGVMGEYLSMLREADGLRARYAGFSLPELLEDARFSGMLRAGLSMEDAYLAMHGREVLRQAIAATHRWTETQLRAQWAEESRRPLEGAMTGGSTALSRTNPAQMSRAQREAIARRVLKGERILL